VRGLIVWYAYSFIVGAVGTVVLLVRQLGGCPDLFDRQRLQRIGDLATNAQSPTGITVSHRCE